MWNIGRRKNCKIRQLLSLESNQYQSKTNTIDGNKISTLSEIGKFDLHKLDRRLNCELASLLEERQDIPPQF